MTSILFVCVHNSARSQMAEAWTRHLCGSQVDPMSAGLEPGKLNPLAVEVMHEVGVDMANKPTQSVFELFRSGKLFAYVVTVCDEAGAERCPVFLGITQRLQWSFADPASFEGSWDEKIARTRIVRDEIRAKVKELCATICSAAQPIHE
jgi:arsenate reductase (thioredoxin)